MLPKQYQALLERCADLEKTNEALVRENVILRQTNVLLSAHVETSPAVLVAQETLFSDNIKQLKEELARAKSLINYLERERLRLKTKVHKLYVWGNQLASALQRTRQQLSYVRVQHNNSESKASAASSQTVTTSSSLASFSSSLASAQVAVERGLERRSYLTPPVDAGDAYTSDDDKSDDSCVMM
jgi:DNA repair exonuclease SbcCD ATPase subunit